MTETVQTPALTASQSSWRCAQAHDRDGWLALMADDILIEEPIGRSVTNPDGTGVRGKESAGAFFDANIATNQLTITYKETFPSSSPDEIAYILVLHSKFEGGFTSHDPWGVQLPRQRRRPHHQHARVLEPRRHELRQGGVSAASPRPPPCVS